MHRIAGRAAALPGGASSTSSSIASMDPEAIPGVAGRAALHRALGEPARLAIVEALALSDRSAGELRRRTGLDWNLLAFHLRVLEGAGVIERRPSEGDRRRRYVRLRPGALEGIMPAPAPPPVSCPLFVCTANAARSPFAAALWKAATGGAAASAGSEPAASVHPLAVEVAAAYGVDLAGARPRGYDEVDGEPDLVVSVCDRAAEAGVPFPQPRLHWSVPDPTGGRRSFETAFADIAARLARLAEAAA